MHLWEATSFKAGTINQGDFSIPALLVSLGGAIILLVISKLFRNTAGFLVIVVIALPIYIYFNCWVMGSASAFCTRVKAIPFLQGRSVCTLLGIQKCLGLEAE